jgi:predicted O-linked N-acetylglucosamine transferase (SPINDLY family)
VVSHAGTKGRPSGRGKPGAQELDTLTRLFSQGLTGKAELLAKSLTRRFPKHGFGWKVLGAVYQAQERYEESLKATHHAVALLPDDAATHNNLGTTLQSLGRSQDAEAHIRKALAIAPDYAKALCNLGTVLRLQGRLLEAEACCRHALRLEPRYTNAHLGLGSTLELQDRLREAQASYRAALAIQPDMATIHTDLLHLLSLDVQVGPEQLFAEHLAFGEQFEAPLRAGWQAHQNTKDPTRCLQVGFVSGDLYNHAVASFLEPVLTFLAQKPALSLHAYYTHTREDAVTLRLHNYFPHWNNVASLSDVELANKIRSDGIDILIDLAGHTAHNRLLTFARKPAPIQVSWMGYPGTTGLQAMDYYLCDRFYVPSELAWQFTEKPVYLPSTGVFQPSEYAPPVNTLPALEQGCVTLGSFNRPNKLNDSVIVLWSMLLRGIPNARMVLGAIPEESQDSLIQSFAHEGIEQNRLTFFPRSNMQDYLALHHQVDICLDTFPYGGGTTTAHAAWMGVPTLTLAGETPPSRSGATFMNHLGLTGFIATSIEDFVSKGHYWAQHLDEMAAIRFEMRTRFNASALGQPEHFTDSLETTLRTMWQRWCEKNAN